MGRRNRGPVYGLMHVNSQRLFGTTGLGVGRFHKPLVKKSVNEIPRA